MPTTLPPGDKKHEDNRFARNVADDHERRITGGAFTEEEKRKIGDQAREEGRQTADMSRQQQLDALERNENPKASPVSKKDIAKQESAPWETNVNPEGPAKTKGPSKKRMKIFVASISVFSVGSILAFSFLLPLKLLHFIGNIDQAAAYVGDKAVGNWVENRLDFYIAARILATGGDGKVDGNKFDQYVCKGGNIACSMFKGWRLGKIEDKLGLKIESNRTGVGNTATKWKITHTESGQSVSGDGADVDGISREIETSSSNEFRRIIAERTESVSKYKFSYKRYATRKMLARKYDVRRWTGLLKPVGLDQKFDNALDKKNAFFKDIRKKLVKATVSKTNARNGLYIECLLGGDYDACKERLRQRSSGANGPDTANNGTDDTNAANEASQVDPDELVDEVSANGEADAVGKEAGKTVSKFLSKKVLASAVAGAGVIDIISSAVSATSDGTLSMIQADRAKVAYAGYYTELATSAHQLKFGDIDPEAYQALDGIMSGMEGSPVAQHQLGVNPTLGTASNPVKRDCNDGQGTVQLDVGEYTCTDKQIQQDVAGFQKFYATEVGQVITNINTIWKNTGHAIIQFFGQLLPVDWLVQKLLEALPVLKTAMADLVDAAVGWIFSTPVTGLETGPDAYDAMAAGGEVVNDSMLAEGQADDGTGMGMGAVPAAPKVAADYQRAYAEEKQVAYEKSSLADKIFNPDIQGSVADRVLMTTPTNIASIFTQPISLAASMLSYSPQAKAFQNIGDNIFHDDKYAWPLDPKDAAYNTDPTQINEATCDASRKFRNDSYEKRDGEIIPMYHEYDPCALEKVGAVAGSNTFTDAYKKDFDLNVGDAAAAAPTPTAQTGTPGQTKPLGSGFTLADGTDYTATPCAAGSTESRIYTHPIKAFKVRLCKVKSMEVASIISDKLVAMVNAAQAAGIDLNGGGFRTYEQQIEARKRNGCPADPTAASTTCRVPTAPPGTGQHERGLAIDFTAGGGTIGKSSAQYKWLTANAAKFGFINYPAESWHWSTSGN